MYVPPGLARTPFVGQLVDHDPISRNLSITGQENPITEERWRMEHGRHLAGLGEALPEGFGPGTDEPDWSDGPTHALEAEDDVVGSGIFDPRGSATVHATMGVFADHPSVPGYIARNPPFTVSRDVADVNSGADVVEVPGGGMAYVERGGHLVGPAGWNPTGPSRGAPQTRPRGVPGPSSTDQVYAFLAPPSAPAAGVAAAQAAAAAALAPSVPSATGRSIYATNLARPDLRVPFDKTMTPVPMDVRRTPVPAVPIAYAVPATPRLTPVRSVSTRNVAMQRLAIGDAATDESGAGWGSYAFAGVLVGAAAALFVGAVKMKGKKR